MIKEANLNDNVRKGNLISTKMAKSTSSSLENVADAVTSAIANVNAKPSTEKINEFHYTKTYPGGKKKVPHNSKKKSRLIHSHIPDTNTNKVLNMDSRIDSTHSSQNSNIRTYIGPSRRRSMSMSVRKHTELHQKFTSESVDKNNYHPNNNRYNNSNVAAAAAKRNPQRQHHQHINNSKKKSKIIQENANKRKKRMQQNKRRKEKIDKERIKHLETNSTCKRQQRIRKRAQEENTQQTKVQNWTFIIILGTRIQAAIQMVQQFRNYQKQIIAEDNAARIITRQMKMYHVRSYRKRVRGAIRVLSSIFLIKVRLWKNSRRRVASDRIRAFLIAVERDNLDSGGCLALIVKGKKWRAYRLKIIILQRLWRQRIDILSAQIALIDEQWKKAQTQQTECEVERIHAKLQTKVIADNEHLDTINRTRKLLKLRPLPLKKCDTRDEIREKMLKGFDVLSSGHIVPTEIRHGIIRDLLQHLRRLHLKQRQLYEKACQIYQQETKDRQRRRALLMGFSSNGIANTWIWGKRSSSQSILVDCESEHSSTTSLLATDMAKTMTDHLQPIKPSLHIVLGKNTLTTLLALGQGYVDDLRKLWSPNSMDITSLPYNAKEAAEVHFRENSYIVKSWERNQSFLSEKRK